VRQACNVAYAVLAEGRSERELEDLDISLGMVEDPDAKALELLSEYQRNAGMTPVDPSEVARLKPVPDEAL
jgi:hypothetical protein